MTSQTLTRPQPQAGRRRAAEADRPAAAPPAFDRDRWIEDSRGYRVEGPGGRIGFVDEVRHEGGVPVLAVRAGLLGRRIFLFPASDVAFIVPRAQRIYLSSTAAPLATEREALTLSLTR